MFDEIPKRDLDADLPLGDASGEPPKAQPRGTPETPPVHTMPDRFFLGDTGSKPKRKGSKLILWLIILIVLAGLGVGAAVLLRGVIQPSGNANVNGTVSVTNQNANRNVNQTPGSLLNLANLTVNLGNLNANANANVNGNANANVNENANANANLSTTVTASADKDSDGLTDVEESLYGTDSTKADTDGDTFLDGLEVSAGYNPKGVGKLEVTTHVKSYTNSTYAFSVLYPGTWTARARGTDDRDTLLTAPGGEEFAEITIQDNPANLGAKQWYQAQSPGIDPAALTTVTTWDRALEGVRSVDGMAAYFAKGNYVYVFSYNVGIKATGDHFTTFDMIARSLKLTALTTTNMNANTNANVNTNAKASNTNTGNTNSTNANSNANTNSSGGANSY